MVAVIAFPQLLGPSVFQGKGRTEGRIEKERGGPSSADDRLRRTVYSRRRYGERGGGNVDSRQGWKTEERARGEFTLREWEKMD